MLHLTGFFVLVGLPGGTSHALGTASLATAEPLIAPPSAVTFLVTGKALALIKPQPKCVRCQSSNYVQGIKATS